jgi:hypothetical protein
LTNAVNEFQEMVGVPVTGMIDEKTLGQMKRPRCGNADVNVNRTVGVGGQRQKRFGLLSGKNNSIVATPFPPSPLYVLQFFILDGRANLIIGRGN